MAKLKKTAPAINPFSYMLTNFGVLNLEEQSQILKIIKAGFPKAEEIDISQSLKGHNLYLAWDTRTNKIIGVSTIKFNPQTKINYLKYIATHPEYKGKGIGKDLLKLITEQTNHPVELSFPPTKEHLKLYTNAGFEITHKPKDKGHFRAVFKPRK